MRKRKTTKAASFYPATDLQDVRTPIDDIRDRFGWSSETCFALIDLPAEFFSKGPAQNTANRVIDLLRKLIVELEDWNGLYVRIFRDEVKEWISYFEKHTAASFYRKA